MGSREGAEKRIGAQGKGTRVCGRAGVHALSSKPPLTHSHSRTHTHTKPYAHTHVQSQGHTSAQVRKMPNSEWRRAQSAGEGYLMFRRGAGMAVGSGCVFVLRPRRPPRRGTLQQRQADTKLERQNQSEIRVGLTGTSLGRPKSPADRLTRTSAERRTEARRRRVSLARLR